MNSSAPSTIVASQAKPSVCMLVQSHYEMDIRVRRKAEALVAAGYHVDVLALRSAYSESRNYQLNGVQVYTFNLRKKRGSRLRYFFEYLAFLAWALIKSSWLMEARRYVVMDVNNLPDFFVFAAGYAKLRGARLVFDMHEITPEFYISKYGIAEQSRLVQLLKWVEKASFTFADHVIVINEPIGKLLESRGLPVSKTTTIMNVADESLFASGAVPAPLENPTEAREKFVMMYHGTLASIYGLDIAIAAFHEARRQMPGAELWIMGNGPQKPALKEQVRQLRLNGHVQFIENVLPHEVPQWLRRCAVGILATRRDVFLDLSFPNKLSEYIIMQKPLISSRLCAIRHYFSDEALAFFEPENPSDLARQMVRLFNDAGLRASLAKRARQEYSPINWEVMKARYLALIVRLTGTPEACPQNAFPSATANSTPR